eukprot:7733580-Prorocentrum_lima.AAC.1
MQLRGSARKADPYKRHPWRTPGGGKPNSTAAVTDGGPTQEAPTAAGPDEHHQAAEVPTGQRRE